MSRKTRYVVSSASGRKGALHTPLDKEGGWSTPACGAKAKQWVVIGLSSVEGLKLCAKCFDA